METYIYSASPNMFSRNYILTLWYYYCFCIHCLHSLKIELVYTPGFKSEMANDLQDAQAIINNTTKFLSRITSATHSLHFKFRDECRLKEHIMNDSFTPRQDTELLVVLTKPEEQHRLIIGADVCQTVSGRPVVIRMEVARSFRFKATSKVESMNWILHAYLHGLAFNHKLMSKLIETGEHYKYFSDANIKRIVQEHSNCPMLEGARIQQKNPPRPSGERVDCLSSAVHWEKLAHWDDIMSYPPGPALTILTTEAVNSLGHFRMKSGPPMRWGENAPCSFLQAGCQATVLTAAKKQRESYPLYNWNDYLAKGNRKYICDEWNTRLMTLDWKNWPQGMNIPLLFRGRKEKMGGKTVSGETLAGTEELFKFCPLWKDVYNGKAGSFHYCANPELQPKDNKFLEVYGLNSICMEQETAELIKCEDESHIAKRDNIADMGAGCYEHVCEDGRLKVRAYSPSTVDASSKFMQQWKVCWAKGSKVTFERATNPGKPEFHRITLICPSCKSICESSPLYKNFTCLKDVRFVQSRDKTGGPCSGCSRGRFLSDLLFLHVFYSIFCFTFH
ncbi:hypothetical protein M514_10637 [Trichuris suis]|uniref:Leishmanolysin-like peptidase n=1 Tax=Trichuris suis TaxID=68888 RepID=A0A085NJP5_9BILA|nr:hypothetical protein M514_10637 [Trichuris suis]